MSEMITKIRETIIEDSRLKVQEQADMLDDLKK